MQSCQKTLGHIIHSVRGSLLSLGAVSIAQLADERVIEMVVLPLQTLYLHLVKLISSEDFKIVESAAEISLVLGQKLCVVGEISVMRHIGLSVRS